jgi:menaquinol-cytochrome c reductase iron-sulfur subunit
MTDKNQVPVAEDRRDFLKKGLAGGISAILGLVPLGAGLTVYLDPLRRKSLASGAVRVTSLDALPDDGIPRKFPVLSARVDAWTKATESPIGAVYLRRTTENKIEAFNVACPHAGCFVDFLPERGLFHCPCHNSTFNVAGRIEDKASPAPRGLDALEVELRNGEEVWVKFQNFQAGRSEKIPTA